MMHWIGATPPPLATKPPSPPPRGPRMSLTAEQQMRVAALDAAARSVSGASGASSQSVLWRADEFRCWLEKN